jgi:hypothetical protein
MNAFCSILFAAALLLQQPQPTGIPATFAGTFKTAEHGRIVVEVENGETMRMYVTHSTKYFRDGKPAKLSNFQNGDRVSVDAERDVRMNLVAVRVEAVKQPPNSNPK